MVIEVAFDLIGGAEQTPGGAIHLKLASPRLQPRVPQRNITQGKRERDFCGERGMANNFKPEVMEHLHIQLRPEGGKEVSHVDIWRENTPGPEIVSAKILKEGCTLAFLPKS